MTYNEDDFSNVKIHIKKYLNKLNFIDKLIKKATNNNNTKLICISQYNSMSLFKGIDDLCRNRLFRGIWKGNMYGENICRMLTINLQVKRGILDNIT